MIPPPCRRSSATGAGGAGVALLVAFGNSGRFRFCVTDELDTLRAAKFHGAEGRPKTRIPNPEFRILNSEFQGYGCSFFMRRKVRPRSLGDAAKFGIQNANYFDFSLDTSKF
jgi:hypothetical protein